MSEQHRAFVHRWFDEVWNQGKESTIDELCHPDAVIHGFPEAGAVTNREGFRAGFHKFRAAFSGIHITVDDVVSEGDTVASRWTASMKHTGDGFGIPPTGEPVQVSGMSFVRLRDGRSIESWNAYDLTRVTTRLQTLAAAA